MKHYTLFLFLLCAGALPAQPGLFSSQILGGSNTITPAAPFLLLTPDARSGALGDCGAATSADAFSMHWNPAKIAFAPGRFDFGIAYTPWLRALIPDVNLAYVSGFIRPRRIRGFENHKQAFCTSLRYFSLGNFTSVGPGAVGTSQYRPNCISYDLGYVRKLSKNFSAGAAVRYVTLNLDINQARTQNFAVDLSAYYRLDSLIGDRAHLGLGINISNLAPRYDRRTPATPEDFSPANLRLGATLRTDEIGYNSFALSFDLNKLLVPSSPVYAIGANGNPQVNPATGQYVIVKGKQPGEHGIIGTFYDSPDGFEGELREITIGSGIEYWYNKTFAVRSGYFHEHEEYGNRQFVTLGAGIRYHIFGLDFAYLLPANRQRSPLENTLRFSLFFRFQQLRA